MTAPLIEIAGQHLRLLPQKAIFWEEQEMLLVADLHLGKATHFRRHGIPISPQVLETDLQRLEDLILNWPVQHLMLLGDLFHSHYNAECEVFGEWLQQIGLACSLVHGNHDLLEPSIYTGWGMQLLGEDHPLHPFWLTHEPKSKFQANEYVLCGHLHPGVRLVGKGRQSLRLPCFWVGQQQLVLPAFGRFTGLAIVQPKEEDRMFAIAEGKVLEVS
ncbi:MAG: ligase-associated DNA damage response endonuclease PdeM [Bacteroidota bacterium]